MPPDSKLPSIHQQQHHARSELLVRLVHAGVPWALFVLLTITGNVLHLVSAHVAQVGAWLPLTVGLTAVSGTVVAGLDYHLRASHRTTVVGKAIGPVTTEAAALMLSTFLVAGYSVPLVLIWMFGGIASCIGWDLWLALGQHHDLALGFAGKAERAGLGQTRLVQVAREPKPARGGASPRVPGQAPPHPASRKMTGTMALPPGEVTPAEAAGRAANFEGAHRYPPGAVTITPNARDGSYADFTVTDPQVLEVPVLWPGPSAPGATMAVPFREGVFQDGTDVSVPMLPVFHVRTMGKTGSAKTTGPAYCQLGEGVTREGYAAMVMDISKGEQFFGAWRPALHRFETDPEKALRLLAGLRRAVRARTDFLAKTHRAEWEPGCGLSYLDIFMAEAPDLIALLETAKTREASAIMSLSSWMSSVKNGRSAGMAWNLDLQLAQASEMPSVAQAQMSQMCLGVESRKNADFGLSARQKDAGCRPELWGSKLPGMAYWDAPTLPDEYGVMPLRFYYWAGGPRQAFEYAQQWEAADRPLDDVTAEALAAEPALPDSYFASPGTLSGGSVRPDPRDAARPGGNVRSLFGRRDEPARPDRFGAAEAAEAAMFSLWARWLSEGKKDFTALELQRCDEVKALGKSRSWLYGVVESGIATGRLKAMPAGTGRKRWEILPQANREEM
jgi:hypothetical protein